MISRASVSAALCNRVQARVEQQCHSGERLHRAVVQLVRQSAPFVLLGGDQLIRKTRAFGLAHSRVVEQLRVLVLARSEVREHGRAHDVLAIERLRSGQAQRTDLLVVGAQRNHDRVLRRCGTRALAGREQSCARLEEPLSLLARTLDHVGSADNGAHRLDECLEEARLTRQLPLGRLVPAAFRHDQRSRDDPGDRDGQSESGERERMTAERKCRNDENRRCRERRDEQSGSSR